MQTVQYSANMAKDCLGEWHKSFEAVVPNINSKMDVEAFQKLCGANPDYQLRYASLFNILHTAIQAAIQCSNLPLSRYIIAHLDSETLDQQSALVDGVQTRSVARFCDDRESAKVALKIIRMLVCKGVNVNLLYNMSRGVWSPLTYACEIGDVALATLLLGCGAKKLGIVTKQGEWPYASRTRRDIADMLTYGILALGEIILTKVKLPMRRLELL